MDVKAVMENQTSLEMNVKSSEALQKNQQIQQSQLQKQLDKKDQNLKMEDIPKEVIEKATKNLEEKLNLLNHSRLKIETDKETGIQVVKIVDEKTKEVIRQLPPETILKIAKYIDEITGLLFEKKI